MELEKIKELMINFDFIKNPVSEFIKKYNVSDSFVRKKLKLWNIPHATKKRNILPPRNRLGQFCLSSQINQTVTTNTTHINSRIKNEITQQKIFKNKKFPENPPDISDEWETINLNESDKKIYRSKK